jgi:hypothetical protein
MPIIWPLKFKGYIVSNERDTIRNTNIEGTNISSSNIVTNERRNNRILQKNDTRRSVMIGLIKEEFVGDQKEDTNVERVICMTKNEKMLNPTVAYVDWRVKLNRSLRNG